MSLVSARAGTDSSCTTSEYAATGLRVAVPDAGTVDSAIAVPAGGSVQDLTVGVNITYPFDSDLQLELVSPSGTVVELARGVGMWGHDFTNTVFDDHAASAISSNLPPFTGHFRPDEPLSALQGTPQGGTWKLQVSDAAGGYAGELTAWRLDLTSCAIVSPPSQPAGAPTPPPLPAGVPSGPLPAQGTSITVTDNTDVSDGDVASVASLEAHPGANGTISLREAIEATNNDPGSYTIQFAPSLSGSTIDVGSFNGQALPALTGGHVLIDGDINGDGRPDITLDGQNVSIPGPVFGLILTSGGNRLQALRLKHFSTGVLLAPVSPGNVDPTLPTHKTFAGNVISGLVITEVTDRQGGSPTGISLDSNSRGYECSSAACTTDNTWSGTRIVGNTIESPARGVAVDLETVSGDTDQGMTIAGNSIQVGTAETASDDPATVGIELKAGLGAGANQDHLSNLLAAWNEVDVAGAGDGISGAAGQVGGSTNLIQNMTLLGNHVLYAGLPLVRTNPDPRVRAIEFALSDGCSGGPGAGCSKNDTIDDLQIVGNLLSGQSNSGVMVSEACCAGQLGSRLTNVLVADNLVEGTIPPDELNPWGIIIPGTYEVSNVRVDSNTVTQQIVDPAVNHVADLAGGGIVVAGGIGAGPGGSVSGVSIAYNRITTPLAGITLVGGGPSDDVAADDTSGHSVSDVVLRGNVITEAPTLARRLDPAAKGIEIIGGLGGTPPATGEWRTTTGNAVRSITLDGNLVNGVRDDVTVHSNFGIGASGNSASLGLHPPKLSVSRSGGGHGSVTSDPAGIHCGYTCSARFDDRTRVVLTALPNSTSAFAGWSGGCTGSSTCTLVMNASQSVVATFDPLCVVPNIIHKLLAAATKALTSSHCSLGSVDHRYSRTVKEGRVISQHPRRGTRLTQDSAIDVAVSEGSSP